MANFEDIRLGVVRGISYGLFRPPDPFVAQARALGAGLIRAYVYWAQIEPEPGRFTWGVIDSLLDQCTEDEELWLTVCSSSKWATRVASDFLPPSPAKDLAAYERFIRELVQRCGGRVKYWQCDNEPSNTGLLWAGNAPEYVTQLRALHRAVKSVDADALVVLGGCGYDVLSSEPDSEPRRFFDQLLAAGRDSFDLFSVHLYGVPARIPEYVNMVQDMMRRHGYQKPIVAGEYGGPVLFEFPEVEAVVQRELAAAFAGAPENQSTDALVARAKRETPERRAMLALYARMHELPQRVQMFMTGCPAELDALRHRINCRQLVTRNVLAWASGIRRTAYWNLAPEAQVPLDPYQIMHLMFGKMTLLDYENSQIARREPGAATFALLADKTRGAHGVERMPLPAAPSVHAFRIERSQRTPLVVLWDERDAFDGERQAAIDVTLPWPRSEVQAIDALGGTPIAALRDGALTLPVSVTPIFLECARTRESR
jgi:hypothetical protein